MGRIIFWIIAILVGLWAVRRLGAGRSGQRDTHHAKTDTPPPAEKICACQQCGLHVPETEALFDEAGRAFCCVAHRAEYAVAQHRQD